VAWLLACLLALSGLVHAATPETILRQAPWKNKEVGRGVTWRQCHLADLFGSPQNLNLLDADLKTSGVLVRIPYLAGGAQRTTSRLARETGGVAAAVNGNFFDRSGKLGSVQFLKVNQRIISRTQPHTLDQGALTIGADERVRIRLRPEGGWESLTLRDVMASNIPLLVRGNSFAFPNTPYYQSQRHPRTAVGLTAGNHLLLLTVDGRSPTAAGMSLVELRRTMRILGCRDALNMDGGGSTTMWIRVEPGGGVVNQPSDDRERPVVDVIAVLAPR